jgi:hypothetical protein
MAAVPLVSAEWLFCWLEKEEEEEEDSCSKQLRVLCSVHPRFMEGDLVMGCCFTYFDGIARKAMIESPAGSS